VVRLRQETTEKSIDVSSLEINAAVNVFKQAKILFIEFVHRNVQRYAQEVFVLLSKLVVESVRCKWK
jgi:hypothetical protein